ncbi:MAG: exonuclease domain-containing protein [Clostridiales bacterium]|nr:exonuclease domain-containing protein [Clostridiales bacterium]
MNYIVLDLEWNQCPYGKTREIAALPFEIIEIGAVRLNESREVTGQFREVVRPQVYTSLHFRTKEVISLRAMDFEGARSFPEVAKDFFAWCRENDAALPDNSSYEDGVTKPESIPHNNNTVKPDSGSSGKHQLFKYTESAFCTWGPADLTELQRNLSYYNIESPFPFPLLYFDIQKIFSIAYEDRKSRKSLEYAVDFLQLPKDISFHSALSDAIYTSLVMQRLTDSHILENSSVDYFRTPRTRAQEIYLHYSTYDKFVSQPFPSRNQAMKDSVVTSMKCPLCGKAASRKIRWFSAGGHNHFCLAWCPKHGYLKGKIRLRQNADHLTYAIRTIKPVSEEEAGLIYDKKEALKARRHEHHTHET